MSDTFADLVDGLRTGEDRAVLAFCERYGDALQRLAHRHMASGLLARVGSDDVVQSVYRTFFRRAAVGQFAFDDSQDLWRLLCAITVTKVREKARHHLRQKRGFDRERALDEAQELHAPEPGPDDQAAFVELFEQILSELDDEERQIVDRKLQGLTNPEIARELGCSERTVRRILSRMKHRFEALAQ